MPSPSDTRSKSKKAINERPTTTAAGDFSSIPPGVLAYMIPATTNTRNKQGPAKIERMNDEIPKPECFMSMVIPCDLTC